jgi:hypothetical protein
VAVRAKQNTLLDLHAKRVDAVRDAPSTDIEPLQRRIAMVELEGAEVAVIAAQRAAPARLGNENGVEFSAAAGPPRA